MSDTPRISIPARIEALGLPQAKAYADFIRQGEEGGPLPCWGAIAARFDQLFKSDEHRQALWSVLVEEGDRRPLLLFMHLSRGQPAVMSKVVEDAGQLPVSLQRALVSMEEVEALIPVEIHEQADHWEMVWADGSEAAPTAAEALAAVRERGRILAADAGASVVVIEWQPTTAIGRWVVMALQ